MKTISKFRKTRKFCILSGTVEDLEIVSNYLKENDFRLIALGCDAEEHPEYGRLYTARVFRKSEDGLASTMKDVQIRVFAGRASLVDQREIVYAGR